MTIALQDNHDDLVLAEINQTQKLCSSLMRTPHYQKMGEAGIFAIVQKAKSIGMNPLDALNGGMYFVQGKCEMSGQAMLAFIRSKGHSVSMDPKSTNSHVRMFGRRADNGDTWTAEFSIEDAKRQGIYRNQWEKMPKVMCMWRCVSQLGRFLFSDVLKGVYVEGEISESVGSKQSYSKIEEIPLEEEKINNSVTDEEAFELVTIISECSPEYQQKVTEYLKSIKVEKICELSKEAYQALKERALMRQKEYADFLRQSQQPKDDLFETGES